MSRRIVVLGYGNPGRQDDGLGPALAAAMEAGGARTGVSIESDYQLCVEDAAEVAQHDAAVFADASKTCSAPFEFQRLQPRMESSFTSHHVTPEAVLALAAELFGRRVEGYMLSIRGYEFDAFAEELSAGARENLAAAVKFMEQKLADLGQPGGVSGEC